MHLRKLVPVALLLVTMSSAAHEQARNLIPIDHIFKHYADLHDTQFVFDPRVKGKANVVGLKLDELTQTNLMDILLIHNFTAYEKDGVVYVLPGKAADYLGSDIGDIWGSR